MIQQKSLEFKKARKVASLKLLVGDGENLREIIHVGG